MAKIRINADDFGLSPSVDEAIILLAQRGALDSVSAFAGAENFPKGVGVGLHFKLDMGFARLFLLSLIRPRELERRAYAEAKRQLSQMGAARLSHVDSHRHIHHIPCIFRGLRRAARERGIARIRIVNERLSLRGGVSPIFDGGLVKWLVLRALGLFSHARSGRYFFSILYTGKITVERVRAIRIPCGYRQIEVCIHPDLATARGRAEFLAVMELSSRT